MQLVIRKCLDLGNTTLTISNEEMNDIIKIDKSLEEFRLLIKDISETIKKNIRKNEDFFKCYEAL